MVVFRPPPNRLPTTTSWLYLLYFDVNYFIIYPSNIGFDISCGGCPGILGTTFSSLYHLKTERNAILRIKEHPERCPIELLPRPTGVLRTLRKILKYLALSVDIPKMLWSLFPSTFIWATLSLQKNYIYLEFFLFHLFFWDFHLRKILESFYA